MSNELQAITTTGLTLYAVLLNSTGQVWNTSGTPAWETYNAANWADYDIVLSEAGAGIYLGDMPGVVAGAYSYAVYEQADVSPQTTDTLKGSGFIEWDGSAEISAAGLGTRLPAALTANGNIKASLVEVLTTALTETAGYLAAGFKKFFNVATPVSTVESVNQTGDAYSKLNSTRAEPGQGAPSATTDPLTKLDYLYKSWRNKKTQTATTFSLYDDAGTTVDQKSIDSDDGTTLTKGEIGTGA